MTSEMRTHLSFENYRLDCRSGELRRNGREVKLQPQPAKLLVLLATRSGEIVTRAEIQKALWGDDTFVDFEHGINFCIKQIRDALGDSAEEPRYVETVPRLGYRFTGQIQRDSPEERDRERPPSSSHRLWRLGAGSLMALLVIGFLLLLRSKGLPPDIRQPRFQLTLPRGVSLSFGTYSTLAISPDGNRVAFVGCGDLCQLYLRERSEIDARLLPGTEGAINPFFSPDGQWLGFGAQGKLKKLDLEHDTVLTLADAPTLRGASWIEDGTILFSSGSSGLSRISADGGEIEQVTKAEAGTGHRWPQALPGGRAVLFEVLHDESYNALGSRGHDVVVVDLATGTKRILVMEAGCPKYSISGHILFGRDGVVYAAPLDLDRLELLRAPAPVVEGVAMWSSPFISRVTSGVVGYDIARDGTLLFSPRDARLPKRALVSLDRQGARRVLSPSYRAYYGPRFSPDGGRVAVSVQTNVSAADAFVLDTGSGAWSRVDREAGASTNARSGRSRFVAGWMPDGERLLLSEDHDVLLVRIDGSERPIVLPFVTASDNISTDGSTLLAERQAGGEYDIWRMGLTSEGVPEPWLATPGYEWSPMFSPDGRWVAYASDDSGRFEIYVRPSDGVPVRHQISTQGGDQPRWSRDGRELFFLHEASLWAAPVRTSSSFSVAAPRILFRIPEDIWTGDYDVSPDGQSFLMLQRDPLELRPLDLVVVPNWVEEMKARLSAAK